MLHLGNKDNKNNGIVGSGLAINDIIEDYNMRKASYHPEYNLSFNPGMLANEVVHIIVDMSDNASGCYSRFLRASADLENDNTTQHVWDMVSAMREGLIQSNFLLRTVFALKVQLCYFQEALYGPDNAQVPEMPAPEEMGYVYNPMGEGLFATLRGLRVRSVIDIEYEMAVFEIDNDRRELTYLH